ncbi:MAG: hypothetical protein A2287_01250 [Candidatus Melainabacteria bacterium RIFOXYA12_FULL_32_12]|nr:MAG: hypothetical protein A2104_01930 [Candidatus Melainabacteria bacterium GWF2_32_7]OGI23082.1 MAG: hypothetical protein A2255_08950 [Candidatus Melainabacteria bacterium RIFOXYA2_FULL_32_9]OGI30131.1 MAG: hypothetical protein A2287_01250 [Candidatus Melainabacteria bacterium RIFOXYA12_FULL_32_12]
MIQNDIKKAIEETRVVEFDYHSERKGYSHRIGEPHEIKHTGASDKLYLWDYDRDEVRAFIIDNISNFKILDEVFIPKRA